MSEMITLNSFVGCNALYGNETATSPFKLNIFQSPSFVHNDVPFNISFSVLDYYNQTVKYNELAKLELPTIQLNHYSNNSDFYFSSPYPNNLKTISNFGTVNFSGVIIKAQVGLFDLVITSPLNPLNTNFTLLLTSCPQGF